MFGKLLCKGFMMVVAIREDFGMVVDVLELVSGEEEDYHKHTQVIPLECACDSVECLQ